MMLIMGNSSGFRAHSLPGRKTSSWRMSGLMCFERQDINVKSARMLVLDSSGDQLRTLWCVGSGKACEKDDLFRLS